MSTTDIIREFKTFSNVNNPLSKELTKFFNNKVENSEASFEFPEHIGNGKYIRTIINKDLEIGCGNIKTKKNIEISTKTEGNVFLLTFCTGSNLEWIESNSKSEIEMNKGEAMLYEVDNITEICNWISDYHYKAFSIMIKPDRFNSFISSSYFNKNIFNKVYNNFKINKFTLPIESKIVIEQILHCPYKDNIKNIYLEGKVIELISICLNEIMEKNINNVNDIKLSKTEIQSLYRAKEILDNSISSPITLTELSKLICLNEFKLKSGFKKVFGKPVYTYLLDRRMELARLFLEVHNISVNEVANMVGYSNSSSFSKAFRKKHGFNPSDCLYRER